MSRKYIEYSEEQTIKVWPCLADSGYCYSAVCDEDGSDGTHKLKRKEKYYVKDGHMRLRAESEICLTSAPHHLLVDGKCVELDAVLVLVNLLAQTSSK